MAAIRTATLISITALVALLGVLVSSCRNTAGGGSASGTVTVTIKGRAFDLEVASDAASIERGLMHRETIPDGTGMIFIFPDAQMRNFWMKNCLTDIDIMFLDASGRVTATHRMKAEAPRREDESEPDYERRLASYPSRWPAQFAIELPPGSLDQLNVRFEDKIELDLDRLKALAR